jgi:hypothetical protein
MVKANRLTFVLFCLFGLQVSAPSFATEWRADADFSETQNPNGQWRYGWLPAGGGELVLFTSQATIDDCPSVRGWVVSGEPSAFKNFSSASVSCPSSGRVVQAGGLFIHPGPSDEKGVVRWIAPDSGLFSVAVNFELIDRTTSPGGSGPSVDVHLLHNEIELFSHTMVGYRSYAFFSTFRECMPGDRIDFRVGYGGNNFLDDSTLLEAVIKEASETVPALSSTWGSVKAVYR